MGKDAGRDAAKYEARANAKAIDEQRRQFEATKALLNPFVTAGTDMLPGFTESATLGGFGANINEILNSGVLDPLRDARFEAINTQLGKGGMLNSGRRATAIANDLTDFTLGIEQLLNGRQGNIVGAGQNAAAGLGGFGQNMATNVGNLQQATGQAYASGSLADDQAKTAWINQLLGLGTTAGAGALAGGMGAFGSGIGAGGGAALGLLFSDSKLKTNIRETGSVGPLTLYEWEWVPELEALGIKPEMTTGFLAEDVENIFPEYVHPICPYKAVDYAGLINKLDEVIH